jgi:hypothetical protein
MGTVSTGESPRRRLTLGPDRSQAPALCVQPDRPRPRTHRHALRQPRPGRPVRRRRQHGASRDRNDVDSRQALKVRDFAVKRFAWCRVVARTWQRRSGKTGVDHDLPVAEDLRFLPSLSSDACRPRWSCVEGLSKERLPPLVAELGHTEIIIQTRPAQWEYGLGIRDNG